MKGKTIDSSDEQRLDEKAQIYSAVYMGRSTAFHYDQKSGMMVEDRNPYIMGKLKELL